jgi:twitching motility two-component system response regulator PilG
MRGNLAEIGIANILNFLESEQQTGILHITREFEPSFHGDNALETGLSWSFLLDRGRINYAFKDWNFNLLILQDYLSYDRLEPTVTFPANLSVNTSKHPELNYLNELLNKQLISSLRAKAIISNLIQENLWEVLSLNRGEFMFKPSDFASNSLVELKISPAIEKTLAQLRLWREFFPYIVSPQQQIILLDREGLAKITSAKTYGNLTTWSSNKLSLIRLSRTINCQLIDLAKALYPYLKKGAIKLQNISQSNPRQLLNPPTLEPVHIVCIHDNVAISKKVEYILKHRGYKSTVFVNPIEALKGILTIQPDLILCKNNFPELSGYELCSMLQNSPAGKKTKFIMLVEEDSFSHRLQSTIACSKDYLTLPFAQNELLITIDKHLGLRKTQSSIVNPSQSEERAHV